jgi:hypothetical protein
MGFPTKLQIIKRKASQQWYVNFPSALAQAMDFAPGEVVEWAVEDRTQLVLNRPQAPPSPLKKTPDPASSISSKLSSEKPSPAAKHASRKSSPGSR